ncbi:MAG: hypothetical protein C5B56_15640 [Proteobacteria bacterium]|nr:MAG: hypothetical protein C5B56_15640 [Pseudomonadota bacterium]
MASPRKFPQLKRGGGPGRGRGRIQRAIRRKAFLSGGFVSTGDVARAAFVRRLLLHGRRLRPDHYRQVRRILRLIAIPIGRAPGRSILWKLI